MNRRIVTHLILATLFFLLCGCNEGNDSTPVTPDEIIEQTVRPEVANESDTLLWGYYELYFDLEKETVEAVSSRSLEFTVNVVKFLNNTPGGLAVAINSKIPGSGYIDLDLVVTIKHPLDDAKFDGYDVRGIFIGEGSSTLMYNTDLSYPSAGTEQVLFNADGYARWYNPTEFASQTIFGYVPGKFSPSGYTGTATLNPYKYFGQGLSSVGNLWTYLTSGAPDVGYFLHGTSNSRNYLIRFPIPNPGMKYGYAITADWSGGAPGDHPSHTRESVGVNVADNSTVYYANNSDKGGDLIFDITVFDWFSQLSGGYMQNYNVYIESTVLTSPHNLTQAEKTPVSSGTHTFTYHVEIPADHLTGNYGNEYWVIVDYPDEDYKNPYGVPNSADTDDLAACFRFNLDVPTVAPKVIKVTSPNGGEFWEPEATMDITWTSQGIPGTVDIEYSTDNFVSEIYTIATGEDNDGVFSWPIPCVYSNTIKVKVKAHDDPAVSDKSDGDIILSRGWSITYSEVGAGFVADGIATDSDGNIYSVCNATSPIAPAKHFIYLQKYDPCGNKIFSFWWFDHDGENAIVDVEVDDAQNIVYVGGYFSGTNIDFDPGAGSKTLSSKGQADAFVCKFTLDGEFVDAYSWGGAGDDQVSDIALNSLGEVFVAGSYEGSVDFDPGPLVQIRISLGSIDAFVSKFNSAMTHQWTKSWGNSGIDQAFGVDVNDGNEVHICGRFQGTVDFNSWGTGDSHTSNGNLDAYLSRLHGEDGEFVWCHTWGANGQDEAISVASEGFTSVYVVGYFNNTVDFDPSSGIDEHTTAGLNDAYEVKFDATGNFQWANTWGNMSFDVAYGVAADAYDNSYVTGYFTISMDADPGTDVETHNSNGGTDAFLVALNPSGNFKWCRTLGGTDDDGGKNIVIDNSELILLTGFKKEDVEMAPVSAPCYDDSEFSLGNSFNDLFISKYLRDGCF